MENGRAIGKLQGIALRNGKTIKTAKIEITMANNNEEVLSNRTVENGGAIGKLQMIALGNDKTTESSKTKQQWQIIWHGKIKLFKMQDRAIQTTFK